MSLNLSGQALGNTFSRFSAATVTVSGPQLLEPDTDGMEPVELRELWAANAGSVAAWGRAHEVWWTPATPVPGECCCGADDTCYPGAARHRGGYEQARAYLLVRARLAHQQHGMAVTEQLDRFDRAAHEVGRRVGELAGIGTVSPAWSGVIGAPMIATQVAILDTAADMERGLVGDPGGAELVRALAKQLWPLTHDYRDDPAPQVARARHTLHRHAQRHNQRHSHDCGQALQELRPLATDFGRREHPDRQRRHLLTALDHLDRVRYRGLRPDFLPPWITRLTTDNTDR